MRVLGLLLFVLLLALPRTAQAEDAARGHRLLDKKGCVACHSTDGARRVGPSFRLLYGMSHPVVANGEQRDVVVDDGYIARSIREPDAEIAAGYPGGTMPRYDVSDDDVRAMTAAIRDLSGPAAASAEMPRRRSMLPYALSVAGFVGFHFLLSWSPVRRRLVSGLTARGFAAVYSLVVLSFFVGIIIHFGSAPYVEVWVPPRWTRWIPLLAMPIAIMFLVTGFSTPGPTTVMQGERARGDHPARGIQAVTRHPALWGFAVWALAHLAANGELHVMLLAGGILVLALVGMKHIDARRAQDLGPAWTAFTERTSVVPFAAIAKGKAKLRLREIGVVRLLVAVIVYVGILHTHALVIGASPYP